MSQDAGVVTQVQYYNAGVVKKHNDTTADQINATLNTQDISSQNSLVLYSLHPVLVCMVCGGYGGVQLDGYVNPRENASSSLKSYTYCRRIKRSVRRRLNTHFYSEMAMVKIQSLLNLAYFIILQIFSCALHKAHSRHHHSPKEKNTLQLCSHHLSLVQYIGSNMKVIAFMIDSCSVSVCVTIPQVAPPFLRIRTWLYCTKFDNVRKKKLISSPNV